MGCSWQILTVVGLVLSLSASTVTTQRLENDFTVVLAFIVEENSEYILPHFLGTLDRLSYSKERITLWIRVEKSSRDAIETIDKWVNNVRYYYRQIDAGLFEGPSEKLSSPEHDDVILALRQEALQFADQSDYVLFAEPDLLIHDLDLLDNLIDASIIHSSLVVAPMLNVPGKIYANFWGEISKEGFYKRREDYDAISGRETKGCFSVSLVHSLFLVHVKNTHYADLSFNSPVYKDEEENKYFNLVGFSRSATAHGGKIVVCNNIYYGEISLPVSWLDNGLEGKRSYLNLALRKQALKSKPLLPSKHIKRRYSQMSSDFDMVYIINLKRRKGRRALMEHIMYELGIENYKFFDAVDGKQLNDTYLHQLQVSMMPGYEEPFNKRTHLTKGEIGCFLSHYYIWLEAQQRGYQKVLILEDDATPIDNMMAEYEMVSKDLDTLKGDWDLLYLGRKIINNSSQRIDGLDYLIKPGYSYWMVAYALTKRGINKVLSHKPLSKMLPTDEYIPILYNQHPNEEWKSQFSPRDLIALSANPRLIFPAQYPGEDNYVSDTEHIGSAHDEL